MSAVIALLIGLNIIIYCQRPFRWFFARQIEMIMSFKNNATLLFITYQIVVTLSSVHTFKGGSG